MGKNPLNTNSNYFRLIGVFLFILVIGSIFLVYDTKSLTFLILAEVLLLLLASYFFYTYKVIQREAKSLAISNCCTKFNNDSLVKENKSLKRSLSLLEDSNKNLERYAYIIAHDFKAPLRKMISFEQLLQKKYGNELSTEAREFLEFISEGSRNMSLLISETLSRSKLVDPKRRYPVDLNVVINDVKKIFEEDLTFTKATIEKDELPILIATRSEMVQTFQNLMCNSLKFRKTTPSLHIEIRSKETKDAYHFSFSDNGIGISKEAKAKIFNYRTKLKNSEGEGIGLSTCKSIVESYGGEIAVESELGSGATFHFSISKTAAIDLNESLPGPSKRVFQPDNRWSNRP